MRLGTAFVFHFNTPAVPTLLISCMDLSLETFVWVYALGESFAVLARLLFCALTEAQCQCGRRGELTSLFGLRAIKTSHSTCSIES